MSQTPTGPPEPPAPPAKADGVRVGGARCARCGQPVQPRHRPFCSQRCADADLGSWFLGKYRVATDDRPDTTEDAEDVDTPRRES
ncbi:MAG: DNA gyrase inhibitor YacG [Rhodospirillaceae bacterium]|nr:DNA gyrase inhibitor YacG [Rhodospirillaceae bacterium]